MSDQAISAEEAKIQKALSKKLEKKKIDEEVKKRLPPKESKKSKPTEDSELTVEVQCRTTPRGARLESVLVAQKPMLLVVRPETPDLVELFTRYAENGLAYEGSSVEPLYNPYKFLSTEAVNDFLSSGVSLQDIVDELLKFWRLYVDTDDEYRILNVAATLLSYQMSKISTSPYLGFYGDTSTGKNQREELHRLHDYRAFLTANLRSANIYHFLENSEGTLILDEANRLDEDPDSLDIFVTGYKEGAKVSRIVDSRDGPRQKAFRTYGFKIFAGNVKPYNKALNERIIYEETVSGYPEKDEIEKDEMYGLIRNLLLIWKLITFNKELPRPNLSTDDIPLLKGRERELFEPLLRVSYETSIYEPLLKFVKKLLKERENSAKETFEAKLTQAILNLYFDKDTPIESARIMEQLAALTNALPTTKNGMPVLMTDSVGRITHNRIAGQMRTLFKGQNTRQGNFHGWLFDELRLYRSALKYKLELQAENQKLLFEIKQRLPSC